MEKTLDIQLQELREQIAQEIEDSCSCYDYCVCISNREKYASIARGQHK